MDKASRMGLRVQDLADEHIFRKKLEAALAEKNDILSKVYGLPTYTVDEIAEEYLAYAERIKPHIAETSSLINKALDADQWVLFEGAQGTLLDLDHGTYPFVTSSYPDRGRRVHRRGCRPEARSTACSASPRRTSRASAPARSRPSLHDEIGDLLIEVGGEYGTTTGRQRRCGWYDAVIVRYAVQVNGLTDLVITKLDVLSRARHHQGVRGLRVRGPSLQRPARVTRRSSTTPSRSTRSCPAGRADITGCRTFEELPKNARDYIQFIEDLAEVPVSMIAVGPSREQTIMRRWEPRP